MKQKLFQFQVIISILLFSTIFDIFPVFVKSASYNGTEAASNAEISTTAIAGFAELNRLSLYHSSAAASFNQELISTSATSSLARKSTRIIVLEANSNIMKVNGIEKQMDRNMEIVPLTVNSSVYVPLSLIVEQFGVAPHYENSSYTIESDNQKAIFNLFTNKAYINGKSIAVNGFYHQGYFYVPVDLIAQALHKTVLYEEQSVVIGDDEAIQGILNYKNGIQVPILMYHHFDPDCQNGITADPAVFEQQMILLKNQGYTTITTQDLIAISKGEKTMPEKPIMITLDDAYESNYQYVYPVLKKLNMKATIFVITSFIEHPEVDTIPIPKMTWAMMKEMSDSGLVAFQSHTNNLHYSAGGSGAINTRIEMNGVFETTEQYEERIYNDLVQSKQILEEKLGKSVSSFAYPGGFYSEASETLLKEAGFELTLTTDKGLYNTKTDSLYLLKRVNIHGKASAESILSTVQAMRNCDPNLE